jgi:hypothetical protein
VDCARDAITREAAPLDKKIMQPGANRHQHRLFDALAQSRSSADPKFRLMREQCPRGLCADAVTGKLRHSKLKSCSPAQTDINTDIAALAQSRSSADPKIQTDRREQCVVWMMRETPSPRVLRRLD